MTQPDVRVVVVDGAGAGTTVDGYLQGPSGQVDLPRYDVGDDVVVSTSLEPDSTFIAVADRYRVPVLAWLVALFAVAVTVVGGWRGVRSLIALALTLVVIIRIVVPLLLAGWSPVGVAIVAATGVTVVTFLLTEGAAPDPRRGARHVHRLALTALLAVGFNALARFTTLRGSEDASYLQAIGIVDIDLGGLLLAAVIFGALGILDDVTVTQAATVPELHDADPRREPARAVPARDERRPVAHRGDRQHARPRLRRRVAPADRPVRRRSPGPAADGERRDGRRRGRPGPRRQHRDRRGRARHDGDRGHARRAAAAADRRADGQASQAAGWD